MLYLSVKINTWYDLQATNDAKNWGGPDGLFYQ